MLTASRKKKSKKLDIFKRFSCVENKTSKKSLTNNQTIEFNI